jgi:ATP-dependent Clp protease, protease subunit
MKESLMAERYRQELENEGIFYLCGRIDSNNVAEAIRWILKENLNRNNPLKYLQLIVNSSGGDLSEAFALIDIIRGSVIPVHTIGLGKIASAGLLIFIAGAKGARTLTPNTSILSHQWAGVAQGKAHELVSRAKEFDLITERMIDHYHKCTGLDTRVIRKKLLPPSDVWLNAEQAQELNLCDHIKHIG